MNKLLYKIELCLVKVIPMIYALLSLLNTTLSYFGIDVVILSYGLSILRGEVALSMKLST